jgi:TPR repeat protein
VAWYRAASDQGHARAMNLLGRCCEHGWGVDRDPATAADWYRRSAEGGYFRGQYNHASILVAEGRRDEGRAWLQAAIDQAPPASRGLMVEVGAKGWGFGDITPGGG